MFRGRVAWPLLLTVGLGFAARAEPTQRDALRARLAQDRVKARFLENEEASLLTGLQELEADIEKKSEAAAKLQAEIEASETRIVELTERIVATEGELSELRSRFGKRAAAMLRLRRARLSRLLRRVTDHNEARRLRDRFEVVKAWDLELIRQVLDATAQDRNLRADLAEKRAAMVSKKEELDSEVESKSGLQEERRALLTAIQKERVQVRRLAKELARAARRLDEYMGRVVGRGPSPKPSTGGFAAQRGRLPWPVTGSLEVAFGKKVDPASNVVLDARGIDIRAPKASPVRAVFEGEVVFEGSRPGFGRLVVLHHAGFYSLYAHLASIEVARGQSVLGQQLIGYVGDSGSTKGDYLYFELRRGTEPVDPVRWLSR